MAAKIDRFRRSLALAWGEYFAVHMCVTPNLVKNDVKAPDTNCEPLSVNIVSGTPNVQNSMFSKNSQIFYEVNILSGHRK